MIKLSTVFILGLKNKEKEDCRNGNLEAKINNSLPRRYVEDTFCAHNPIENESTCPGDNGKEWFFFQAGYLMVLI